MSEYNICLIVLFLAAVNNSLRINTYSAVEKSLNFQYDTFGIAISERRSSLHCAKFCASDLCCLGYLFDSSLRKCTEIRIEKKDTLFSYQIGITGLKGKIYKRGCDYDWIEYRGHCYFIGPSKVTWKEAKAACLGVCSHLVEIDSKEESEWLANTFLNKSTCAGLWSDCTSWTGGNDLQTEGHYKWDWSNLTMTFTNWHDTEPSLRDPGLAYSKDCIDLMRDGRWNDRQCHFLNSYICEKRII